MHATKASIIPRDLHFGISKNAERYWLGGDAIATSLFDCFSILLPEGERFFIRSLKHYAAVLNDPELNLEIKGYSVQEAFHTREHEDYNRALKAFGYDVEGMEKPAKDAFEDIHNHLFRLAVTCAIEHITATFSIITLRNPALLEAAAAPYRKLWMWHALEELEHQAVALNVFKSATADMPAWKRYLLRTGAMNGFLFHFSIIMIRSMKAYARQDNQKTGLVFWAKTINRLWGRQGYARLGVGTFLRYYSPWFDPSNNPNADLIERGREWLDREVYAHQEQPAAAG